ncbi:MAG: hypothetical protein ACK41W_18695 [Cyanobacteriota bacterium]
MALWHQPGLGWDFWQDIRTPEPLRVLEIPGASGTPWLAQRLGLSLPAEEAEELG